ncbi:MAG: hypothetical protein J6A01_06970 [Proteobacteria bacterium]|nr:hypothetical protein [Pseudomonadota bacterium]
MHEGHSGGRWPYAPKAHRPAASGVSAQPIAGANQMILALDGYLRYIYKWHIYLPLMQPFRKTMFDPPQFKTAPEIFKINQNFIQSEITVQRPLSSYTIAGIWFLISAILFIILPHVNILLTLFCIIMCIVFGVWGLIFFLNDLNKKIGSTKIIFTEGKAITIVDKSSFFAKRKAYRFDISKNPVSIQNNHPLEKPPSSARLFNVRVYDIVNDIRISRLNEEEADWLYSVITQYIESSGFEIKRYSGNTIFEDMEKERQEDIETDRAEKERAQLEKEEQEKREQLELQEEEENNWSANNAIDYSLPSNYGAPYQESSHNDETIIEIIDSNHPNDIQYDSNDQDYLQYDFIQYSSYHEEVEKKKKS